MTAIDSREQRSKLRNIQRLYQQSSNDVQTTIKHHFACNIKGTACDDASYEALVKRLLEFCPSTTHKLALMRSYSRNCLNNIIQYLEDRVENHNVFETGINMYGMWWLANRGVVRTGMNIAKGLLYIHVRPWIRHIEVVNLLYYYDNSEVPTQFTHVMYQIDEKNSIKGKGIHRQNTETHLHYPTTVEEIPTMTEIVNLFETANEDMHSFLNVLHHTNFTTLPQLILMFYKLMNGETNGAVHRNRTVWDINMHRFPEKNTIVIWQ